MNKLRYFVCATALLAAFASGTAKGAIEAVSFLNVSGFGFFVDTGGGVAGGPITNGVQVTLVGAPLFTSSGQADVFSIAGGPAAAVNGAADPSGLEIPIQQEGSAFANNSLFPTTNAGAPIPHAIADTTGSGAAIAGLGFPFGSNVSKTAQAELTTANAFDIGTSDASDTSTASFTVQALANVDVVGIFDATRFLVADLTPAPPGNAASASTSLSVVVTQAGNVVFQWAPNGQGGGITGGTEFLDPFTLNATTDTSPGSTSTFPVQTGTFSAGFTLLAGNTYSFSVTETVSADVSKFPVQQVIPEASTIFVWSLLALCGGVAARRYGSLKK